MTGRAKVVAKFESARSQFSDQPPTADDVPMTVDGRRLHSPELLIAYLAEIEAKRLASDLGHSIAS